MLQDIRYGLRILAKSPGFAAVAILTLALGIGANTALFSVVNGVLLNPLPFSQPDRLVAMYERSAQFEKQSISYPNFLDWLRDNRSFSEMAAFREDDFDLTGMGMPQRVTVEMVSASFFPLLGVKPVIGRTFLPQEDELGGRPVVLLSDGFWHSKYGGSPSVLGRSITLNNTDYTIIGVIPAGFRYQSGNFHRDTQVFVPIGQWSDPIFQDRRAAMGMDAVGRLKPGVTLAQARADMDAVAHHLSQQYPNADKDVGITLSSLKEDVVGDIRPFLLVLLAAVGFVLLIACANVANLLLARSTGRTREFAIRTALGAGQGRVVRQLLTESILLSLAGGAIGLGLAAWGTQAALRVLPEALPRAGEVHLDARVLLFTLAASLLAGVLFGLVPALKTTRADIHETLKEGGRGSSGARHRAQRSLVAVEMGMAVVLLIGAGLMIRSLEKLWTVNPGFDPHNVLTFALSFPMEQGTKPDAIRTSLDQVRDRLQSVPGVEAASLLAGAMPMAGDSELPFWIDGQPKPATDSEMPTALFYAVQPGYLKAMDIPLVRGRFLTSQDNAHSPQVIVIDQQFARLYFHGQNPIGQRVHFELLGTTPEIVGIVGHVKQWGLDSDSTAKVQAQFYFPISQVPDALIPLLARGSGVVVRTANAPQTAAAPIRGAMERYNSRIVMYETRTMDSIIADSLSSRRFSMILLGAFAGLALLLSCIGIYGVISYLVGQRLHEIGIRLALGAQQSDVLRMILGEGASMALIGVGIGLAAALALTRLMERLLFGVSAHDPVTFLAVAALLFLVALAACYMPALRATRVDPARSLRFE
ncbi:MAG: ABC transporter permease [Acidobacteriota bacterium]|nr:ABC transporter permease [Acidobacteriota bacterium]